MLVDVRKAALEQFRVIVMGLGEERGNSRNQFYLENFMTIRLLDYFT